MRHLTIYETESIDDLVWSKPPKNLSKASSIMEVFTDFLKVPPMVIEDHALAVQISDIMIQEHVRMKIVVDKDNHFKGILPLNCITEEKINQKILSGDFTKDNLFIKHCMVPKTEIQALDFQEIQSATIGDVLEALKHIGHKHCLVIDHKNHQIRGLISANDISRALDMPPIDVGTSSSFLDVFRALIH